MPKPWAEWRVRAPKSQPLFREYLHHAFDAGFGSLLDVEDFSIGPQDALVVVDMQCDFLPVDELNPYGGSFAVEEGGSILPLIVRLMEHFGERGAVVVATRDYHPSDHCSFMMNGGHFPAHCVQGTPGSFFHGLIGTCLEKLQSTGARAEVVFKGFHEGVDSFGCFTYSEEPRTWQRLAHATEGFRLCGCSSLRDWTGAHLLRRSAGSADVNAPPDVLAAFNPTSLADYLKEEGVQRVFVCGLALDFCVADTACNGAKAGFEKVWLILDAARAAHIEKVGSVGSGFLNEPATLVKDMEAVGARFVPSAALVPSVDPVSPKQIEEETFALEFPDMLGPFQLVPVKVELSLDLGRGCYQATEPKSLIAVLQREGIAMEGAVGALANVTLDDDAKIRAGLPPKAEHFVFVYPLAGTGKGPEFARGYLSLHSAEASFFTHGGFVYLDEALQVIGVMAMTVGEGLEFEEPRPWKGHFSSALAGRWRPVSMPFYASKGAKLFTWINPREVLAGRGNEHWQVAEHGALVYLFHGDAMVSDPRDIFFSIKSLSQVAASQTRTGGSHCAIA